MSTEACVILVMYPPYWETMVFHPSKETHFGLFYNAFPSFVCALFLTVCLLSSRCASRGLLTPLGAYRSLAYNARLGCHDIVLSMRNLLKIVSSRSARVSWKGRLCFRSRKGCLLIRSR